MHVGISPLRISFAGGGTDFPKFFQKNNYGAVLSTSINKYIYVIVKKHSEFHEEKLNEINVVKDVSNGILNSIKDLTMLF